MLKKPIMILAAAAAPAPALAAQDAEFARFVAATNESAPVPSVESAAADILETLHAIAAERGGCVPSGVEVDRIEAATAVRAIVQGVQSGHLTNAWTAYGQPRGCGGAPQARFLILGMPDGSLRSVLINEGESLANLSLMRDSSALAALGALQAVVATGQQCDGVDMKMGPTRVVERSADLRPAYHGVYYAGSWREAWTFTVCGKRVEVPIEFTADGQSGASYNIRGSEARLID